MQCRFRKPRTAPRARQVSASAIVGLIAALAAGGAKAQPAQGAVPDSFPGEHMQCYRIPRSTPVKPEKLVVADQFGKGEVVLGRPVMLCNPSTKTHNGKTYGVPRERRNIHLVCYEIRRQEQAKPQQVEIANQFGVQKTAVDLRQMFCAPSLKKLLTGREFPLD